MADESSTSTDSPSKLPSAAPHDTANHTHLMHGNIRVHPGDAQTRPQKCPWKLRYGLSDLVWACCEVRRRNSTAGHNPIAQAKHDPARDTPQQLFSPCLSPERCSHVSRACRIHSCRQSSPASEMGTCTCMAISAICTELVTVYGSICSRALRRSYLGAARTQQRLL